MKHASYVWYFNRVASWNVRTLLDNANNPQRRTAIIGHELEDDIDIADLSEMRIHGETQLKEVGAGYTFFLIGHPLMGLHKLDTYTIGI